MKRFFPVLLLLCAQALAQVAVDQSGTNSNSTTQSSGTCVLPSIAANTLVILTELVDDDGTTTFNTPTGGGLTFVQIGSTLRVTNDYYFLIWRAFNSSSQGSTTLTGSWNTTLADWNFACASFTGTAGTAGNNGSDAIGGSNSSSTATTTPSVTVTSTSHNNSKYFGAIAFANSATLTITPGASYSAITASVYNSNFEGLRTELSTNPVTPAANTAVSGTVSGAATADGIWGVEILVAASGPNIGLKGKVGFTGKVGLQ